MKRRALPAILAPMYQELAVGIRVAGGRARFAKDPRQLHAFRDGEVLVADTATPDWEAVMKRAAAIVTNRGERTCHAAIRIPAVVGAENATEAVADGAETTVSCAEGDTGLVYAGRVPFEVRRTDLGTPPGRGRPSSLDNGRGGARAPG